MKAWKMNALVTAVALSFATAVAAQTSSTAGSNSSGSTATTTSPGATTGAAGSTNTVTGTQSGTTMSPSTGTATGTGTMTRPTPADSANMGNKDAQAACENLTGQARSDCLRDNLNRGSNADCGSLTGTARADCLKNHPAMKDTSPKPSQGSTSGNPNEASLMSGTSGISSSAAPK